MAKRITCHRILTVGLAVVPFLIVALPALARIAYAPSAEPVSREEAEILIYLLPQAEQLRTEQMDIGWELQTSAQLNQADFFVFWVVNNKRPNVKGSVTVGYFAVNKHTAEIYNMNSDRDISTPEIDGVQKIIRKARSIDQATINRYHSRRPDIPSK
jgi:hypothetical protein